MLLHCPDDDIRQHILYIVFMSIAFKWYSSPVQSAFWLKYPNPLQPHVMRIDTIDRQIDPKTRQYRSLRLLSLHYAIPSFVQVRRWCPFMKLTESHWTGYQSNQNMIKLYLTFIKFRILRPNCCSLYPLFITSYSNFATFCQAIISLPSIGYGLEETTCDLNTKTLTLKSSNVTFSKFFSVS